MSVIAVTSTAPVNASHVYSPRWLCGSTATFTGMCITPKVRMPPATASAEMNTAKRKKPAPPSLVAPGASECVVPLTATVEVYGPAPGIWESGF
jgi:hypothetical protein